MNFINRLLIATALLATGSFALAAPDHGHGDHHRHDGDRRWHADGHRRYGHYRAGPRYYGHPHRWERGHRYYGPTHVVRNYGYYRLRPPPRGYHWVRADDNYLLVAVATGIILDVALH
jgi:Ni/Co efflux regulator RcnB